MNAVRGCVVIFVMAGAVFAAGPADEPWFVDDEQFAKAFSEKLIALAEKKATLRPRDLKRRLTAKTCKLELPPARQQALTPETVYRQALPGVFVVGSVLRNAENHDEWEDGTQASAFALTADGVLVTNWHVFVDADGERFGAANYKGEVFPVVDILAGDPVADVIVIKVAGQGFQPLPLADEPGVGAWVGVLSHPGGHLFSFTQGHILRYQRDRQEQRPLDWMVLSADFAVGSSGAPVLDRHGNMVGLATATVTLESEADEQMKPKTRRRIQPPAPAPRVDDALKPQVQMIMKQAVPARTIRQLVSRAEPAK